MIKKPTPEEALAAIHKAAETGRVRMAETDTIEEYEQEADEICDVLERVLHIKIGFLSDRSTFGDFYRGDGPTPDSHYERLGAALGIPIKRDDTVIQVCRLLREQTRAGRS